MPGQPLWRASLPGAPALRPALARVEDRTLLLLPWGNREAGTGGVVALDIADGSKAWDTRLDTPVEGGVAVAETAGVAVVGLSRRGHLGSEGALTALDLRTGQECWPVRVQAGGAVEAAPVTDGIRAYVAADDGQLYGVEVASGRLAWKNPVADKAVRIPAPPALHIEGGIAQTIILATYGVTPWQDDGRLVMFDAAGRRIWVAEAGGQARGAPVIAKGRVYVAAYRGSPATGVLSAFDLRTGQPAWPEPFAIPAPAGGRSDIVAAPLVADDTVYVGSHDHRLYAVDAATGKGRQLDEVSRGIASAPAWVEGLVVFGANDGALYAVDAATGERVWEYKLGGHLLTGPLVEGGTIFAAADNGAVVALPWHAGRYAWAAVRQSRSDVPWPEQSDEPTAKLPPPASLPVDSPALRAINPKTPSKRLADLSAPHMFPVSVEEPGIASELQRIITHDLANLSRYLAVFDPHPSGRPASLSTESYATAQMQVDALKGLLKGLVSGYRRYQSRSYRVLFRDEPLAEAWGELQEAVSQLFDLVDKTGPKNYSRVGIWNRLDMVSIAYDNTTDRLNVLVQRESRA